MTSAPKTEIRMRRVAAFTAITAFGFVLGKLSGLAREMLVSAQFGLSSDLDAYLVALTVPTVINNVIAGGTIVAAMMPILSRYLARGDRIGFWRAASVVTNIVLLITGALTIVVMLLPAPIIALVGGGFAAPIQETAARLLVITMPTLVLSALLNMLLVVLNALERFVAPALIFLALNLGIIVTVIVLAPSLGIYAVAWGFLIGVGLQVAIQFIELRHERPQYFFILDWHHPALPEVLRAFVPIAALSIIAQINIVVDKAMATMLPTGSVSALYYADSILGLFYMLGTSLGIGVFPSLSRSVAVDDLVSAGQAVTRSIRMLIFVLAPLTFLLIVFAAPIIGLILGRGKFDASAVAMTSSALGMYAIGLMAMAILNILQRAFYALSDSVTPFVIGTATMFLHIVLNLILMQTMLHAGIALSASISTILGAAVLIGLLARRLPSVQIADTSVYLLQCSAIAFISTLGVMLGFDALRMDVTTWWGRIVGVMFAALGGAIYFGIAFAQRVPEGRMLWQWALSFVRREVRE
ncbi:MAG: murein biosynthesis integral membrane protein MurJ [Anaerolineae bacterium]|nr:murein biosynthesis integral membrane protein MurJ [Anaerolineae bacterium]